MKMIFVWLMIYVIAWFFTIPDRTQVWIEELCLYFRGKRV